MFNLVVFLKMDELNEMERTAAMQNYQETKKMGSERKKIQLEKKNALKGKENNAHKKNESDEEKKL